MSSIDTLAQKIKSAHPEYSDLNNLELVQKIVAKYPQYKDMLDAGDQTALANLSETSTQGPVNELVGANHDIANVIKSGISGLGDVVAGNGLQQAATDVEKVQNDEKPETTAGKVGEAVGGMVTPAQIAIQAGLGGLIEAIGPWAANVLKGWGEQAALNAAGIIKRIGANFGLDNLDGLAQFLLSPVQVGEKEMPAIVRATSSTKDMLAQAQTIADAAGKQLEAISEDVDKAVNGAVESGKDLPIDWEKLQGDLEAFKSEIEENTPNLGEAVVGQYEKAIADADRWIQKALSGTSDSLFSDLGELKTSLGKLIFKHGKMAESKAELQDAYHIVNSVLESAATKADPKLGANYQAMNSIYHKAVAVVDALSGKATGLATKDLFTVGAPSLIGSVLGGVPGAITGALVGAGAKAYGPQIAATGLTKLAAPALPYLTKAAANIPAVGIASALMQ